jgi:hypothetical protein
MHTYTCQLDSHLFFALQHRPLGRNLGIWSGRALEVCQAPADKGDQLHPSDLSGRPQ